MNRFGTLLLLVVVLVSLSLSASPTQAQGVYESEHEILLAFYDSTGGDAWRYNTNWKTTPDHCTWYGVGCNGESEVVTLSLHHNLLAGSIPPQLGGLANLTYLALHANRLSGPMPPQLGGLVNLQYLDLHSNLFVGYTIPPELGNLANLRHLDLSRTGLTRSIPPELGNLTNLQHLDLYSSQFSGSIPPELGNLTNLHYLKLAGNNQLTGPIPPELGHLTNLQHLDLSASRLTGPIPVELGNLSNLQHLDLAVNLELTGPIPAELGHLINLQYLRLNGNQLTGPIPPELGNLTNLQDLFLNGNSLTGPIPSELGKLTNLRRLVLSGNRLTGSIPPELGNLTSLKRLDLTNNPLSGSIPPRLGSLTNLQDLFLINNQLTGPIPAELGNMTNLYRFNLRGNQLSGSIPPELGGMTNLQVLDLIDNQLSGLIPPELGHLANLQHLHLNDNQLSGPIPPQLGNLTSLKRLDLSNNDPSLCVSTPDLRGFLQALGYYNGPLDLCNSPPTADAGGPYSGNEGSEISFDASATTDPDGDELQYRWDFNNDGNWDTEWSPTPIAGYTWDDDWTGQAKVEVTDGLETASNTAEVTIYNVAPTATFANTADPYLGLPNTLTAGESAILVFSEPFDPSGPDTAAGFIYAYGCNGTFQVEGTSDTQYTCTFPDPGTFTAIGRITDKDGGSTDYSISIEVLEPSQAIDEVIAAVEDLNLANGVDNSLDAKLEAVKQALEDINTNNDAAAINSLQAFINAVEAQRGKEISDEQADFLIAAARRVIDSLDGG